MMMHHKIILLLTVLLVPLTGAYAQTKECNLVDGMTIDVEASATVGSGDMAPMWLYSNRQGIVSPYANSAYERIVLTKPYENDSLRKWKVDYAVDLTLNQHALSAFMVHQAYADIKYKKGTLTIGQKENKMQLKNELLSSGSQTLGINALPIPELRIALDDYLMLPFMKKWVGIKGHIAYGIYTDANWQKRFTGMTTKYNTGQLHHSKAGYILIHKPQSPLSIELGLEMAAQFGGNSYSPQSNGEVIIKKNPVNLKSFFNVFVPTGGDVGEGLYANSHGNTVGSWLARVSYDCLGSTFSIYADKYFEDHSAMFLLDYDGYGTGASWNDKVKSKWIMYDLKDMMLGVEWKRHSSWYIDNVVCEYLYTKYQSGPVYHDRSENMQDHVAGKDNYYNHYIFSGWQNWGLVMGNPLYLSPVYNDDHSLRVHSNRFVAMHLGIGGTLLPRLSYRLLASWQQSLGTYPYPYMDPREDLNLMAEVNCRNLTLFGHDGFHLQAAIGMDHGELRGNNLGVQLTFGKTVNLLPSM